VARKKRPELLRETTYEQIRLDIIICALMPGTQLSEREIGERYRAGKATVRAALARLAQEGLIRSQPRRGYTIAPVTMRDVAEIFDARLLIEPATARLAAAQMTPRLLADLERAAKNALKPEVLKSRPAFLTASRGFRIAVAEATGNFRLVRIVGQLLDESERILHLGLTHADLTRDFVAQHQAVIAAMEEADTDAVTRIVYEQIESTKRMIVAALISSAAFGDVELRLRDMDAR
jgi:DNA-binding GntR family transcriptional regulator